MKTTESKEGRLTCREVEANRLRPLYPTFRELSEIKKLNAELDSVRTTSYSARAQKVTKAR